MKFVSVAQTGDRNVIQEESELILSTNVLPAMSRLQCEDKCSLCSLHALQSVGGTGLFVRSITEVFVLCILI